MKQHDPSFGIDVGDVVRVGNSPELICITEFVRRGLHFVGNGHAVGSKQPRIHLSPAHMFVVTRREQAS